MAKFNVDGFITRPAKMTNNLDLGEVHVNQVKNLPGGHKALTNLIFHITGGGLTEKCTADAMELNRVIADLQVGESHTHIRTDAQKVTRRVVFTKVEA